MNDTGSVYWYGLVLRSSYTPLTGATAVIVKSLQVEPQPISSTLSQQQLEAILAKFYICEIARICTKFECEVERREHDAVSSECVEWCARFGGVYFGLYVG